MTMEAMLATRPIGYRHFLRSIRIETDWSAASALDDYVITPAVRQLVARIVDGLMGDSTERAWTLTGPYGTGKSAFVVFVARLLAEPDVLTGLAWQRLRAVDARLAERLTDQLGALRLLPVLVTARRASLGRCLLESLQTVVVERFTTTDGADLRDAIERALSIESRTPIDDRLVLKLLDRTREVAAGDGFHGLLVAIDELGKALEFVARDPSQNDLFLLQELAEYASRSAATPVLVLGVLHQAFEHYAQQLDGAMRREWAKVQGRFADVAFLEPPAQILRLAAAATKRITQSAELPTTEAVVTTALAEQLDLCPPGMDHGVFRELLRDASPLHPTTFVALPYLFRRFAQNERSVFSFLGALEPFGLQDHLQREPGAWLRLPHLFDYVLANLSAGMQRHTVYQRWLEIVDILDRATELTALETEVLKAVGILTVLAEGSRLRASAPLIAYALADEPDAAAVRTALDQLQRRSLLVYRRFSDSYRIWEGSDVDINERLNEARRMTAGQLRLASTLERYLPHRPLAARRHAYETGALRFLDLLYLDDPITVAELKRRPDASGAVICCLPSTTAHAYEFMHWAEEGPPSGWSDTLIALPQAIGPLREAAEELVALHWVRENTPSLRDDRVARRELELRLFETEASITRTIERLLDPRPAPVGSGCAWYWRGQQLTVNRPRDLATVLSDVMDSVYAESPRIHNELLNRRELSSAGAAARRTLIERMLTAESEPRLGIEGFPPERSMYESVLAVTGLHRLVGDTWTFSHPSDASDPARLAPAWSRLDALVFGDATEPVPVSTLFAALSAPPYGVLPGLLPVLLCAFLLVNRDEVSMYREGAFLPEPSIADFEVLLRRPELFAVGGVRVHGERRAVVERLAARLGVEPAVLPIVRALLRMVRTLPEHAWRTRRLSQQTLAVREAFASARSPERLLFCELPMAIGEPPLTGADASPDRIERFFDGLNRALRELADITSRHIEEARDVLLAACGCAPGAAGWEDLRVQARHLAAAPVEQAIRPFLARLQEEGDYPRNVESVLALVASRPPRTWTDTEVERFPVLAKAIGERFRDACAAFTILDPREEAACRDISAQIQSALPTTEPPHVLRAALLRALQALA